MSRHMDAFGLAEYGRQVLRAAKLELVLSELEDEARRYAAAYSDGSEGRNTFLIFADKIVERRRAI